MTQMSDESGVLEFCSVENVVKISTLTSSYILPSVSSSTSIAFLLIGGCSPQMNFPSTTFSPNRLRASIITSLSGLCGTLENTTTSPLSQSRIKSKFWITSHWSGLSGLRKNSGVLSEKINRKFCYILN